MQDKRKWICDNICIVKSYDMKFDYFSGERCFIIGIR